MKRTEKDIYDDMNALRLFVGYKKDRESALVQVLNTTYNNGNCGISFGKIIRINLNESDFGALWGNGLAAVAVKTVWFSFNENTTCCPQERTNDWVSSCYIHISL